MDVFYQEMNYVILLIFWLVIDTDVYLHISFYFSVSAIFFIILYYVYDFIIKLIVL